MIMFDLKKYLTLNELNDYIKTAGYNYDLSLKTDKAELLTTLQEFMRNKTLTAVIYLDGIHNVEVITNGKSYVYNPLVTVTGYFDVKEQFLAITPNTTYFPSLYLYGFATLIPFELIEVVPSTSSGFKNRFSKDDLLLSKIDYRFIAREDDFNRLDIDLDKIQFPKFQIDNIFFQKPIPDDELLIKNARLKHELKNTKRQLGYYKKQLAYIENINHELSNGFNDELLLIGAMLNCLKNLNPSFKQLTLIEAINKKYPSVKNLSPSTIKKKFSKSKSFIKQYDT